MTEPLAPLADTADLALDDDASVRWASAKIRGHCGWHIYPERTDTVTLDSDGSPVLLLPSLRVSAVQSVTVTAGDDNLWWADSVTSGLYGDGTAVGVLDYTAGTYSWSRRGMLRRLGRATWPRGFQSVTVTYTHGYPDLPDDLVEVVVSLSKRMPKQLAAVGQETLGRQVGRIYNGVLSGGFASTGFTYAEEQTLARYRVDPQP